VRANVAEGSRAPAADRAGAGASTARARGAIIGASVRTVILNPKTGDEPNDWTKCLLGHAGLRGSIAAPLTLLEIEDRQVAFAVCDL
jgi:hypothetical protein